jgi:hypothetical protein
MANDDGYIPCPTCSARPCTPFRFLAGDDGWPNVLPDDSDAGYLGVRCPAGHWWTLERFEHLVVERHGPQEIHFD